MFVVAVEADAVVSTTSMTLAEGFARLHKEALTLQVLLTQLKIIGILIKGILYRFPVTGWTGEVQPNRSTGIPASPLPATQLEI